MALLKYLTWQGKPTNSASLLIRNEVEEANKAKAKVQAKVLEWKMVQWMLQSIFLKMEHQNKWINCKKTEYLEKLKETSKHKSSDNSPCAYPYIKMSSDPPKLTSNLSFHQIFH